MGTRGRKLNTRNALLCAHCYAFELFVLVFPSSWKLLLIYGVANDVDGPLSLPLLALCLFIIQTLCPSSMST